MLRPSYKIEDSPFEALDHLDRLLDLAQRRPSMADLTIIRCHPPGLGDAYTIALSHLDKVMVPAMVPFHLVFALPAQTFQDRSDLVDRMKVGLEKTLSQFPAMFGKVGINEDLQSHCLRHAGAEDGDILSVQGLRETFQGVPSYAELVESSFAPAAFTSPALLPSLQFLQFSDAHSPACSFRITFIPDGAILSCAFNHLVGDVTSFEIFLTAWAANCNPALAQPVPSAHQPGRFTWTSNVESDPAALVEELKQLGMDQISTWPPPAPSMQVPVTIAETILRFPSSRVKAIAAAMSAEHDTFVSPHDCLSAVIWKAFTRARLPLQGIEENSPLIVTLNFAVNLRRRKSLNVARSHFGNASIAVGAKIAIDRLLGDQGVLQAARSIRDVIVQTERPEGLSTLLQWSKSLSLDPRHCIGPGTDPMTTFTSSWAALDCYTKFDFGFGPCRSFRSAGAPFPFFIVLPTHPEDGGQHEALIAMESDCLPRLLADAELAEYLGSG